MLQAKWRKALLYAETVGAQSLSGKGADEPGYSGAVAVDYKEAAVMMEHGFRIGNGGHLVQIPTAQVRQIVSSRPEVINRLLRRENTPD